MLYSESELSEVLRTLGEVLSEEETEEFIDQADLDGDGNCSHLTQISHLCSIWNIFVAFCGFYYEWSELVLHRKYKLRGVRWNAVQRGERDYFNVVLTTHNKEKIFQGCALFGKKEKVCGGHVPTSCKGGSI